MSERTNTELADKIDEYYDLIKQDDDVKLNICWMYNAILKCSKDKNFIHSCNDCENCVGGGYPPHKHSGGCIAAVIDLLPDISKRLRDKDNSFILK